MNTTNTPGFTAEASLYRSRQHQSVRSRSKVHRGDEVVSQLSQEEAESIRDTIGVGTVRCSSGRCLRWSTGYDPGVRFCTWWDRNCYWWPW